MKSLALVALASLTGCFGYAVRPSEGPAVNLPVDFYGVGPGATTSDAFVAAGWALAEETTRGRLYVIAAPDDQVREAEASVSFEDGEPQVDFVRLHYRSTRLTTYRALLDALQTAHGPPQLSEERPESPLLWVNPHSDRPRPTRVVVHRWKGQGADLVLVAGLEAEANLQTAMTYQLLLVRPD